MAILNGDKAHFTEEIQKEILELTKIELNHFTQFLGLFILVIVICFLFILWVFIGFIVICIFMLIIGIIFSIINELLTGNMSYSGSMNFLWVLILPSIIATIWYGLYFLGKIGNKINIPRKLQEESIELYKIFKETTNVIEEIPHIISSLDAIYSKMQVIKRLLIFRFMFSKLGKDRLHKLLILITQISIQIITNLRSDLALRLTEQQKTLEQAKSEIEKTIRWTSALEQVSELQKARLDRQIEQFEELQKVLVRV